MTALTYLDFDLRIQPGAGPSGAYVARIVASPAGEPPARPFDLPASQAELDSFVAQQPRPSPPTPQDSPIAQGAPQALGSALFTAIFDGEILAAWRSSVTFATGQGKGLRLRLRLNDTPELAALPWEFLFDSGQNSYLVLSAKTPIVRYLELAQAVEALTVTPPLRILAVVSSPADYPALNAEQEWDNLQVGVADLTAAGKVVLDRLDTATLSAMQGKLRRQPYHIIHFIGHGGFDPTNGGGLLVLEDEAGNASLAAADRLGALLRDSDSLRLVVLNSCEGGRTSPGNAFAGTAQTLVQQGIPGVIAMQFEISDTAAVAFSREFYGAIADLYPVDAAVSEARKAIYFQNNDREWATPVLFLRAPDARIFQPADATPPDQKNHPITQSTNQPATVSVTISGSSFSSGQGINIGNIGGGMTATKSDPAPAASAPPTADLGPLPDMETEIRTHLSRLIQLEDKLLFADTPDDEARWRAKIDPQRQILIERITTYQAELADRPTYTPPTDIRAAVRHVGNLQ